MQDLKEYIVEADWEGEGVAFQCLAENEDHAIEQTKNAYPGCKVTRIR